VAGARVCKAGRVFVLVVVIMNCTFDFKPLHIYDNSGSFRGFQSISGPQRFQIHKAYGTPDRLPSTHTRFV
jgi:hypothetical protein